MQSPRELLGKLLSHPSKRRLPLLSKIMLPVIPFNIPHAPEIRELSENKSIIELKNIVTNRNHLGGIHACAIATIGEYAAGILIARNFGFDKYRIILRNLNTDYFYQGRGTLLAESQISAEELEAKVAEIENASKADFVMETVVSDKQGNKIAVVSTTWQLKDWKAVKTK